MMNDGLLRGKWGIKIKGKYIINQYDLLFKILDVYIPVKNRYKYKTLNYLVECQTCKKQGEITYQNLKRPNFNYCECNLKKITEKKTREEMVEEINSLFEEMITLLKQEKLNDFLKNKYPVEWEEIMREYGT